MTRHTVSHCRFPLLSAGLCLLIAPPARLEGVIWVALVPLFAWLMQGRASVRQAAFGCAAVGWVYYLGMSWPLLSLTWWGWGTVTTAALWRQTLLIGAVMIALTGWGALLWGICGALVRRSAASSGRAAGLIPCLWVALVEGFGHWAIGGMSWGTLGYHAHGLPAMRGLAGLTGVYGASFFIIAVNAVVAYAAMAWMRQPRWAPRRAAAGRVAWAAIGLVVAAGATLGWTRRHSAPPPASKSLAVAVLQGNVTMASAEDFSPAQLDRVYGPMLSQALKDGAKLIILPETVWLKTLQLDEVPPAAPIAGSLMTTDEFASALRRQLGGQDAVVAAGLDSLAHGRVHNAITWWSGEGLLGAYFKRVLVPFAEARPQGLGWLAPANRIHGKGFAYEPGAGAQLVRARGMLIGGFICQEVMFPHLIRESVAAGAEFLVTAGNDGVFASPWVAEQMAVMAQFRAAESGRYLIRSMKNGVSAIIGPTGQEIARAQVGARQILRGMIEPRTTRTPYIRWGGWCVWICGLLAAWLLAAGMERSSGRRRPAAGFTLVEVLVSSVIASVIAGGTLMAFVTAMRINHAHSNPAMAEASGFAQQTLESLRNNVAADSAWFSTTAGTGWNTDALPGGGGSESIQSKGAGAKRCYRVTKEDCDGDTLVDGDPDPGPPPTTERDCYAVSAHVCWDNLAGCQCP